MFGAILKATNSSFQKGMLFCRSIYVKKVMKLLAFIFEQPSYRQKQTFWIAVCLPDWRQMVNSSDLRSTFIDCSEPSRLSPIRCNKVAYLMIIEYFGHFSIKHKRRYLNSQRISVSRLKWQLSPLQSCYIGNKTRGQ